MVNIYGVSFKEKSKIYYFKIKNLKIAKQTEVIVDTEKGSQYGKVVTDIIEHNKVNIVLESIKDIIRIATKEDKSKNKINIVDAAEALEEAKKYVNELKLDMTLLDASYTFDRKQLLFNFTSDDRVDFRELAKRLASKYHTRIELRQIGARDKAKEVGGVGQCGRCLCCSTFLNNISSIGMNMAKNQNIALNPSKINGQCGRLLCCLTYENEEYKKCSKGMPSLYEFVETEYGKGKVVSVSILERTYKVDINGQKYEIVLEDCSKNCNKEK